MEKTADKRQKPPNKRQAQNLTLLGLAGEVLYNCYSFIIRLISLRTVDISVFYLRICIPQEHNTLKL